MNNLNTKPVRLTDNYITSRYSSMVKKTIILITTLLNATTLSSWCYLIKCVHIELIYVQGKCENWCVCKCGRRFGGNTTIGTVIGSRSTQSMAVAGCILWQ